MDASVTEHSLASNVSDANGQFVIMREDRERTEITPKLKVPHHCEYATPSPTALSKVTPSA